MSTPEPQKTAFQDDAHPADESKRGRDGDVHPLGRLRPMSMAANTVPERAGHFDLRRTRTTDSTRSYRRSLAAFAERFRSSSRPQSRSQSRTRGEGDDDEGSQPGDDDYQFKYSGRRSSDFTGAYADIARAQALFMERLRDEQLRKNIKTNIDGIPIPPPSQRRKPSITQILGVDKGLLAR